MEAVDLNVTFGPVAGDWATLSKASRTTLQTLYRHPIAHNLEWSNVVALFTKLGSVDHKSNNEIAFVVNGAQHVIRKPHSKDLAADEVMEFRHILTQAGWSPVASSKPKAASEASG